MLLKVLFQGEFSKASPSTMASRRIVSALHLGKKEQFAKHIQALNQSFHDWFHEQMKSDPSADYTDGFQVSNTRSILSGN